MSGQGEEVKPKPTLVRLPQNGNLRKPLGLGSPRTAFAQGTTLQSFKEKRDLTLGAGKVAAVAAAAATTVEKKKFVPNLNVTRNIKKETPDQPKAREDKGRKERKENKHDKREKQNNHKDRPALIQTLGSVFADGIGGDGGIRRRGGDSGGGGGSGGYREASEGSGGLARPKLELNIKVDREAEEERLRSLLRDDFIDDLKEGSFVPVQLPMIETGKIFSEVEKSEKPDEDGDIKPKRLLSKKSSVLDSDDDDEEKIDDPSSAVNSKAVIRGKAAVGGEGTEVRGEYGVADLVRAQCGEIFFIQLPDHLPVGQPKPPDEEAASQGAAICSLANLQEGLMGRLQIRQSGRCQLVLGDQIMDVEVGTKVGFLQDAVSVRMPVSDGAGGGDEGSLTVLGHVRHRLVMSPDWDSLLRSSGLNSDLA